MGTIKMSLVQALDGGGQARGAVHGEREVGRVTCKAELPKLSYEPMHNALKLSHHLGLRYQI